MQPIKDPQFIRNFCVIAHINHGKSTLADRLLELTHTVQKQRMHSQFLDSHPIERERGITIKLAPVKMRYLQKGQEYDLNLIDTPGHVDFSYEVSRSLAACEGALLIVDAVSGVQAQTVANFALAKEQGLKIIPLINKIDLQVAQPEKVALDLIDNLGFSAEEIIFVSAKTGENMPAVLEAVVARIPPPKATSQQLFRGLVFNSAYDPHKGVIVWVRAQEGQLTFPVGQHSLPRVKFLATQVSSLIQEVGFFTPEMVPADSLYPGQVGYLATGIKDLSLCQVGDTVVLDGDSVSLPLQGYRPAIPMLFASLYPIDNQDFLLLKESLEKLKLSDSSLSFTPEFSQGLGKGFRCGFLGLLHAEIIKERLFQDFDLQLLITSPTVRYQVEKTNGEKISIPKPADFPDPSEIKIVFEPMVKLKLFSPLIYLGALIDILKKRRGQLLSQEFFGSQVQIVSLLPLSEMITDLYDEIKSLSSGFASFAWELSGFQPLDAAKLEILLNGQSVEAFSKIIPRSQVQTQGRSLTRRLRELLPRQQFEVAIQAAVGGKIVAREDLKAFRKDVTAKLYGGDQTRKDKLLKKQKKGKKKLKMIGRISIPQEVFFKVLKQ